MSITVVVTGLEELQAKSQAETVTQPIEAAIQNIGSELATAKGGGLGVRVNTLALAVSSMAAVVETSLVWPRETGNAWEAKTIIDFEAAAADHLPAAGAQIEELWEG